MNAYETNFVRIKNEYNPGIQVERVYWHEVLDHLRSIQQS